MCITYPGFLNFILAISMISSGEYALPAPILLFYLSETKKFVNI